MKSDHIYCGHKGLGLKCSHEKFCLCKLKHKDFMTWNIKLKYAYFFSVSAQGYAYISSIFEIFAVTQQLFVQL